MAKKIISLLVIAYILIMMVWLLFIPKGSFSELENRYLAKFPKFSWSALLEGKYISGLQEYIQDGFPMRNQYLTVKITCDSLLGKQESNGVFIGSDEYLIDDFGLVNDEQLAKVSAVFNNLFVTYPNVDFLTMVVPNSIAINNDKLPKNAYYIAQNEVLDDFYQTLNGSKTLNLIDSLRQANNLKPMYYRLDHHWTSYGAYQAYLAYCQEKALVYQDNFVEQVITEDFNGSLYSKAKIFSLMSDEIVEFKQEYQLKVTYFTGEDEIISDSIYQTEFLSKKDKYSYFLNANQPLVVIVNELVNNGHNLLIIKDSYANCLIPFLVGHYQKIVVVDPRYYNLMMADLISEHEISDGLIVYNLKNLNSDLGIVRLR